MPEITKKGDLTIAEIESFCQMRQNNQECKLISITRKSSVSGDKKNLYKFTDSVPPAQIPRKPILKAANSDSQATTLKSQQVALGNIFLFDEIVYIKDDNDEIKEERILGFEKN